MRNLKQAAFVAIAMITGLLGADDALQEEKKHRDQLVGAAIKKWDQAAVFRLNAEGKNTLVRSLVGGEVAPKSLLDKRDYERFQMLSGEEGDLIYLIVSKEKEESHSGPVNEVIFSKTIVVLGWGDAEILKISFDGFLDVDGGGSVVISLDDLEKLAHSTSAVSPEERNARGKY